MHSADAHVGDIYNCKKILKFYRYKDRACCDTQCIYCGKINHNVQVSGLDNPRYNSCLCKNQKYPNRNRKLYSVFFNMRYRCENPNCHEYHNYGAKGIKVCQEWVDDYMKFETWAYEHGYEEGLTIDRIDADGDYCPENCEWVTLSENVRRSNFSRDRSIKKYYYIDIDGNKRYFRYATEVEQEVHGQAFRILHAAHGNEMYNGYQFGIDE